MMVGTQQQQFVLEADPFEPQQIAPQIDAVVQVHIHRVAPSERRKRPAPRSTAPPPRPPAKSGQPGAFAISTGISAKTATAAIVSPSARSGWFHPRRRSGRATRALGLRRPITRTGLSQ